MGEIESFVAFNMYHSNKYYYALIQNVSIIGGKKGCMTIPKYFPLNSFLQMTNLHMTPFSTRQRIVVCMMML